MSEPCRCERADAITSLVASANATAKALAERDDALAEVTRLELAIEGMDTPRHLRRDLTEALATLATIRAIVADPHAALVVDQVRAALEPTDQPKGTK